MVYVFFCIRITCCVNNSRFSSSFLQILDQIEVKSFFPKRTIISNSTIALQNVPSSQSTQSGDSTEKRHGVKCAVHPRSGNGTYLKRRKLQPSIAFRYSFRLFDVQALISIYQFDVRCICLNCAPI